MAIKEKKSHKSSGIQKEKEVKKEFKNQKKETGKNTREHELQSTDTKKETCY